MLQDQITQYTAEINAFDTTSADELEQFRIRFLGTKGIIKDIFDEFKAVSPEEKRTLGKVLNEFKQLCADIKEGKEIEVSDAVVSAYLKAISSTNAFADSLKREGQEIQLPAITDEYRNALLK